MYHMLCGDDDGNPQAQLFEWKQAKVVENTIKECINLDNHHNIILLYAYWTQIYIYTHGGKHVRLLASIWAYMSNENLCLVNNWKPFKTDQAQVENDVCCGIR